VDRPLKHAGDYSSRFATSKKRGKHR
jgi:hypothetical protein